MNNSEHRPFLVRAVYMGQWFEKWVNLPPNMSASFAERRRAALRQLHSMGLGGAEIQSVLSEGELHCQQVSDEGYRAAKLDICHTENPYKANIMLRQTWHTGWLNYQLTTRRAEG